MTIWDTTSATGGSGTGSSWSDTNAGAGYQIQSALVPTDFIGAKINTVWFYINTNITSSATDPIHAYIIDGSGSIRETSSNSISRASITTSFQLFEFTFSGTTSIANGDNLVAGFSGASGSGGMNVDGASGNTCMRTFNNYNPSTLNGPWSGQYRFKVDYGAAPSASDVLLPPEPAMVRL